MLYWLKKSVKNSHFWSNSMEKCQFFDFLNFLFLQPRKAFFVVKYHKRHFPGLYCLKKKIAIMATFGPKAQVNPFGKTLIFSLFELLVFGIERRFFVLEYRKRHFPGLSWLKKKKLDKWSFLEQNRRLTLFEKCQVFVCLKFLFLQPRKVFSRSRISQKTFSWPLLPKKKS